MTLSKVEYDYPPLWGVLSKGRPYEPFVWQARHLHSKVDAGFKRIILACGRRSGKSTAVVAEVAREAIKPPVEVEGQLHSPIIYIVGPTSEAAMRVWEPVWAAFVPPDDGSFDPPLGFLHQGHDKNRGVIFVRGGGRIYRKTADDDRSLQGERVTLIVVDEAQDVNEAAWGTMMPGLADSDGLLIAIGITKGRGRFRSYWNRGQSMDDVADENESRTSRYYSASVSTAANPVFARRAQERGMDTVDYIRATFADDLTEQEFQQQYLAKWLDEDGAVFSNFERLFTSDGADCEGPYLMGLDLGKMRDFTVAYVVDVKSGKFVDRLRFNKIDYVDQVPRIVQMYQKWGCRFVHMDANGVGQAPAEMLSRAGCSVLPFRWSNENKQALVATMVREVEKGNFTFLKDDDVLKREMTLFEAKITPSGVIKYEAPAGYYDDCVMAAALAIYKASANRTMGSSGYRGHYATFDKAGNRSRTINRIREARQRQHEERVKELV